MKRKKKVGMRANKRSKAYPDQTAGSKLASKVREKANKLSDQKRAELFKRGLSMIYGTPNRQTASSRH
jgi:hypothetical protein